MAVVLRGDHVLIEVVEVPPVPAGRGTAPKPGRTDYVVRAKGPSVPSQITVGLRVVLHKPAPADYVPARPNFLIVREAQVVAGLTGEDD